MAEVRGIRKLARDPTRYRRQFAAFPNARSAIGAFLRAAGVVSGDVVLLPAYIGWSPREGSGVLDPITALGLDPAFYRVDHSLRIDLEHLEAMIAQTHPVAVLLIHFFGYCDPQYPEAVVIARRSGAVVLEDEAHAMYSDLVGGRCGRMGEGAVYSLHKLLPVQSGGVLVVNPGSFSNLKTLVASEAAASELWQHDLAGIAEQRRQNAAALTEFLAPLAGQIDPLWGNPQDGDVPQTYPVLVRHASRDRLYEAMNDSGYGVVTLYHTLVNQIRIGEFPDSHQIARTVLNLPVHQDLGLEDMRSLVAQLASFAATNLATGPA